MKTLSLELAKELQEACKNKGVQLPESYFSYAFWIPGQTTTLRCTWQTESSNWKLVAYAYTLDELLLILPRYCRYNTGNDISELTLKKRHDYHDDVWFCGYLVDKAYSDLEQSYWSFCLFDPNPANAAGKLLIWCIQEGYLK